VKSQRPKCNTTAGIDLLRLSETKDLTGDLSGKTQQNGHFDAICQGAGWTKYETRLRRQSQILVATNLIRGAKARHVRVP
jgi:hypothetical protein